MTLGYFEYYVKGTGMIDLFRKLNTIKHTTVTDPGLERTLYLLEGDIFELVSYYYRENYYLKRPNMLITLLENMYNDPTMDEDTVMLRNKDDVEFVIKDLGITSEINVGKIHKGVITKNYYEVFVKVSMSNLVNMDSSNYMEYNPINIKYFDMILTEPVHPKTIVNPSFGYDYLVYEIDVEMLNMQYYYWCREQIDIGRDIDPARFLYSIALANMIDDVYNAMMVYLYLSLLSNEDYPLYVVHNTINIPTRLNKLKNGISNIVKKFQHGDRYRYEELLQNIRLINNNGTSFLKDNVNIYNSYNTWTYWLKYIDIFETLLKTSSTRTLSTNKDTVEQFKKHIKHTLNNKYLDKVKHPILDNVKEKLETIYKEY